MLSNRIRLAVVGVGIALPSLVTWLYFDLLADTSWRVVAYGAGKLVQFALPVVWVGLILRQRWKRAGLAEQEPTLAPWTIRRDLVVGIGLGLAVVGLMVAVYRLIPAETVAALMPRVRAKVESFHISSAAQFAALGLFYAILHSGMEEYYFRWFLYGQLRAVATPPVAAVVSGLAFMAHHVIVLHHYFADRIGWTIFLSLSIAVGGVMWAFQYERSRRLWGIWMSHAIVDAGIFAVGYQLLGDFVSS